MLSFSRTTRPVRTQSLRTQVYETLLERIQQGAIGRADRLLDLEIASDLGVSRMPVREALLRLTHEGYLAGTSRGFMLPTLTYEDMSEIFEVRKLLEPRAAAMAARDIQDEQIQQLATARDQAQEAHHASNSGRFIRANSDFRQVWLQAVSNGRLSSTINRFADHVQAVRFDTLQSAATREIALAGLGRILLTFQHHDVLEAQDCMARFLVDSEDAFFKAWSDTHPAKSDNKPKGLSASQ